jgi:hypothetical protein
MFGSYSEPWLVIRCGEKRIRKVRNSKCRINKKSPFRIINLFIVFLTIYDLHSTSAVGLLVFIEEESLEVDAVDHAK